VKAIIVTISPLNLSSGFLVQLTEWERQVFKLPQRDLSFLVFYLREYFGYDQRLYTDQEIENALSNFILHTLQLKTVVFIMLADVLWIYVH
jgi:hypothetical protein